MTRGDVIRQKASEWRADAQMLLKYGDERGAAICELHAADVERALADQENQVLSLRDAAGESGLSPEHLARLVRKGRVRNAGRKGAPRIRRGDLPQRPTRVASSPVDAYDPAADARALLGR